MSEFNISPMEQHWNDQKFTLFSIIIQLSQVRWEEPNIQDKCNFLKDYVTTTFNNLSPLNDTSVLYFAKFNYYEMFF